jgi:hypothetical protein
MISMAISAQMRSMISGSQVISFKHFKHVPRDRQVGAQFVVALNSPQGNLSTSSIVGGRNL